METEIDPEQLRIAKEIVERIDIATEFNLMRDLANLAAMGCTNEEVAALLDCSVEALEKHNFTIVLDRYRRGKQTQPLRERMRGYLAQLEEKKGDW